MAFSDPPELPEFIENQFPFRRRSYRLESGSYAGKALHFVDEGNESARPVLLLHGNPTWSFLWRKVIAKLDGFRCIAPDLMGLGFSDRIARIEDHSLANHTEAVVELVVALDLDRIVLVVQDWGGPIGACVAAKLRERFDGVVIGNTAILIPERLKGTAFHRFSRVPILSDLVFRGLGFPQNILHRVQGDRQSIRGEVARAYREPLRRWRDRVAPLALARMVPDHPEHPSVIALREGEAWLVGFEGPMSLVWGMNDPILGRALKRHERTLTNAHVIRTQAGHFLQEEVPDVLADEIRRVASESEGRPIESLV